MQKRIVPKQKQQPLSLRTTAILAMILISFPFYIGFIILLRSYILLILYYLSFFGAIPARAIREAVQ
jgi:hypothetical protein